MPGCSAGFKSAGATSAAVGEVTAFGQCDRYRRQFDAGACQGSQYKPVPDTKPSIPDSAVLYSTVENLLQVAVHLIWKVKNKVKNRDKK